MSKQSRPIVILGMPRSGTSALSGALARLGVFFGKEEFLYAADGNNREGYYEHRKSTLLNLRILDEFQMHVASFTSLPENWKEFPQAAELRGLLKDFLKEDFRRQERWGIKQPLTSLVLPIYNEVFRELGIEPRYAVCVRNPLENMESESKLDFGDGYRVMQSLGKMAIGSWLRFTLGSICETAPNPIHVVAYDNLLNNPRSVLESIVATQSDWIPTEEQWDQSISSIRSDLRHNRRPDTDLDALPAIVGKTYRATLETARKKDSILQKDAMPQFIELYREFKTWARMMGDPAPSPGKLGLAWIKEGSQRISEVGFPVQNQWQTISLEVDAGPKAHVSGLIYGLPARVWIRRCVWTTSIQTLEAPVKCGPASRITNKNGLWRLEAAFEPQQIRLVTPAAPGPYRLEVEFLLQTGPAIHLAAAARMARQLEHCVSAVEALSAPVNLKRVP